MQKFKYVRDVVDFINEKESLYLGDYGIKVKTYNSSIRPTEYDACFDQLVEHWAIRVKAPGVRPFIALVSDAPGCPWIYYVLH